MSAAVLDELAGAQVAHIEGRRRAARFARAIGSVADLDELGARLNASDGVTELWLTPRYARARAIAGLEHAWTPARFAGGAPSAIVAPSLNRRLAAHLERVSGAALLQTLSILRGTLGIGIDGTPGQTAEALLRGSLASKGEYAPLSQPDILPRVAEPTLNWIRPLDTAERACRWVLAIDRRAAYLQSMSLADVGLGDPEYVAAPDWRVLVWTPGYYHARLSPWREAHLPDPLTQGVAVGDSEADTARWLTAPSLRLAENLGRVLHVDEAWVWQRKSRTLAPVARRILRARAEFAASAPTLVPYGDPLLKRAYTELVGRLRMEAHRGTPLYRPDWYSHVVADARCRIWAPAWAFLTISQRAPAAVNLDCWYVLADEPELPPPFNQSKWWRLDAAVEASTIGLDVFDGSSVAELSKRVRLGGGRA